MRRKASEFRIFSGFQSFFLTTALVTATTGALASDGVIEINQARALKGSVTASDAPGFPVTIDQPGSYILTGNLETQAAGVTAIEVLTSDIDIDLNGFSILGPFAANATDNSCPASGGGDGVSQPLPHQNARVHNGSILGMGGAGVDLSRTAVVEHLRVICVGGYGIKSGGGRIERNEVTRAGHYGIATPPSDASIRWNIISETFLDGINGGGHVTNNRIKGAGSAGIRGRGHITDNTVSGAGQFGIDATSPSRVSRNIVSGAGTGISMPFSGQHVTYDENHITNNTVAPIFGGTNRGGNYCAGTGTQSSYCP